MADCLFVLSRFSRKESRAAPPLSLTLNYSCHVQMAKDERGRQQNRSRVRLGLTGYYGSPARFMTEYTFYSPLGDAVSEVHCLLILSHNLLKNKKTKSLHDPGGEVFSRLLKVSQTGCESTNIKFLILPPLVLCQSGGRKEGRQARLRN